MRNVPLSQPVETPVARAADARANIASETVQARSWARRSRVKRASVACANRVATAVATNASAITIRSPSVRRDADSVAIACEQPGAGAISSRPPLVKSCTKAGVGCSSRPAPYAGPVERTWRTVPDRPDGNADGTPRRIPEATVARLPLYYRALLEAADQDVGTVSSERLAELAGVNAAKVRKDLSFLGSYGTRGVGYEVDFLVDRITAELGLTADWPVAIVGLGNLGQALANYRGFGARGFRVLALVDTDPAKVGERIGDLAIEAIDDLSTVVRDRGIKIGIIATPAVAAQEVADRLVAAGVSSILNFAPAVVAVPDSVSLRKVDLAIELQILAFYQSHPRRSRAKQEIS